MDGSNNVKMSFPMDSIECFIDGPKLSAEGDSGHKYMIRKGTLAPAAR